jgi:hypothetical protein
VLLGVLGLVPPGEEDADAELLAVGSDNAAGVLPLKKWM